MGDNLSIVYEVELKTEVNDFQVTSYLTQNIDQCDVALTKKAKKRKTSNKQKNSKMLFF